MHSVPHAETDVQNVNIEKQEELEFFAKQLRSKAVKRFHFNFLYVGVTLVLLGLIIFRTITRNGSGTSQQVGQAVAIADSFSKINTISLSLEQFDSVIKRCAETNLNSLGEIERNKLLDCVNRFYACYSSGDFEKFKKFRLHRPFVVGESLSAAAKKTASDKKSELKLDEDVLRFAWEHWGGSNKIGGVAAESVRLDVVKRPDLGLDLRQPSAGKFPGLGASCWEGAVKYEPSPDELLKKEGSLRFFTLELFVRFAPLTDGPATPLLFMGYWDSKREDWMPLCLCTVLQVGDFDTIF
jgi:hypothetical protein